VPATVITCEGTAVAEQP